MVCLAPSSCHTQVYLVQSMRHTIDVPCSISCHTTGVSRTVYASQYRQSVIGQIWLAQSRCVPYRRHTIAVSRTIYTSHDRCVRYRHLLIGESCTISGSDNRNVSHSQRVTWLVRFAPSRHTNSISYLRVNMSHEAFPAVKTSHDRHVSCRQCTTQWLSLVIFSICFSHWWCSVQSNSPRLSQAGDITTNTNGIDVGASMISVSIRITVGLFESCVSLWFTVSIIRNLG